MATISGNDTTNSLTHDGILLQQLSGNDQRPADVQTLNRCLEMLVIAFPQYQPYVFRNMLQNLSEESRLAIVADRILTNPSRWAPSHSIRHIDSAKTDPTNPQDSASPKAPPPQALLQERDLFRSLSYKSEVQKVLEHEFVGLMRYKITNVIQEENYSYFHARERLYGLVKGSWISSVMKIFSRRHRYVDPSNLQSHPLINWKTPEMPSIKWTACGELNDELWQKLIVPYMASLKRQQAESDQTMAYDLTYKLAEEDNELYECECCFGSELIEYIVSCDSGDHFICLPCVKRSASEAVYGQNWTKAVNPTRATIKCIGLSTTGECSSCIPIEQFESALYRQQDGISILEQIHSRITSDGLRSSGTSTIQCPFCSYLEIDEEQFQYSLHSSLIQSPLNESGTHLRLKNADYITAFSVLISSLFYAQYQFKLEIALLLISLQYLFIGNFLQSVSIFCSSRKPEVTVSWSISRSLGSNWPISKLIRPFRMALRLNHGIRPQKFICQSPRCGVTTCQNCKDVWRDIHRCRVQPMDTLRTRIEAAASLAVTRTCQNCNLPFVKSDGCNKIVCRCGTSTCYVCDENISQIGYQHFCPHFREEPGMPCREGAGGKSCDRCDLYHIDDDARQRVAIEKAVTGWGAEMAQRDKRDILTRPVDSRQGRSERVHLQRSSRFVLGFVACGGGAGAVGANGNGNRGAGDPPAIGMLSNIPPGAYAALYARDLISYLLCLCLDVFDMVRSIEKFADWLVDFFLE